MGPLFVFGFDDSEAYISSPWVKDMLDLTKCSEFKSSFKGGAPRGDFYHNNTTPSPMLERLPCAYAAHPRTRMACAYHAHVARNPNVAHAVRMPCAALIMRTPCACHAHAQVSRCACMRAPNPEDAHAMARTWRARACAWCARARMRTVRARARACACTCARACARAVGKRVEAPSMSSISKVST